VQIAAVYFIATYDITDSDRYERDYVPGVVATLAAAGGEVVVASGSARHLEGTAPGHSVVVRFPSAATFRDWYDSDDYTLLRRVRSEITTNGTAVLADEFPSRSPRS
jgi:uncharacterized protein (DUF1330 family)